METKTNQHAQIDGKCALPNQCFKKLERNEKTNEKHSGSKKSFSYKIYAGTSKVAHKVFQQRGAPSIREFSLLLL